MTSELVIITPELAAGTGGVADHTLALLRCWEPGPDFRFLVAPSASKNVEHAGNVGPLGTNAAAISEQLPSSDGKVLLQYSAYGFNPFGYPRNLLRGLIEWKKRNGGCLVVMFHEIWTIWPFINRNFLIQKFHQRSLKELLEVCDAVFTSTSTQAEHLRHLCHDVAVHVLPVGSNIRPHSSTIVERRQGVGVLFGMQQTRIRALENMKMSLGALASSGQIKKIVSVGQGTDPRDSKYEHDLLAGLRLSEGFVEKGSLGEQEISRILSSATFGIFGQSELSCTKSGSFMAYAAHQLYVLADFADPSKPPPICWTVAPAELLSGLSNEELHRRAECLRLWQKQNCSWNVIAATLGRALGIEAGQGSRSG